MRTAFVAEMYHELLPDDPALAGDMCWLAQAFYLGAVVLEPPVTGEEYHRLTTLPDRIMQVWHVSEAFVVGAEINGLTAA